MAEPLSPTETDELARCFPPGPAARTVLIRAGFPLEAIPGTSGILALDFWSMVAEAVDSGQVPDGRDRLMAAALERRPANEVFAGSAPSRSRVRRVLVVGADPRGQQRLRADRELRAILEAADLGHLRVTSCPAAAVTDLRRLLDDDPTDLLHLACHGDGSNLIFEDAAGQEQPVPAAEVARTLAAYHRHGGVRLHGLVLGSCHGDQVVDLFRGLTPEGVAHTGVLDDDCAVVFAHHLYRDLRTAPGLASAALLAARHTVLEDDLCQSLEDGLVVWPAPVNRSDSV